MTNDRGGRRRRTRIGKRNSRRIRSEPDPGGAPAAGLFAGGPLPGGDFREVFEEVMNALTQGPGAFPVNDADGQDAALDALGEIIRQQLADLGGTEGVKVE